jgi:hypothetical protein
MQFIIVRKGKNSGYYEVYHQLIAVVKEVALVEAAEYLSDGGAPLTGDPKDTFEVFQVVSHPLSARLSSLAATKKDREFTKEFLLKVLKEGEK